MKGISFCSLCAVGAGLLMANPWVMAAPVEFDTDAVHVIVVRPFDVWSGDKSAMSDSLDAVKDRKVNYRLQVGYKQYIMGGYTPLSSTTNPVVLAVREELSRQEFAPAMGQGYYFTVGDSLTLDPARYTEFVTAQAEAYKALIVSQGDPDTLSGRVSGRKFAGGVLSLLTVGLAGAKFGAIGAQTALNTGIAGDVYQAPLGVPDALAPATLPPFDPSGYKQMEVRIVTFKGGMTGQIILAYKDDKTAEAELPALVKAITIVAGVGTTAEEIEKSRADDLAYRKSVWSACLADGKCKAE